MLRVEANQLTRQYRMPSSILFVNRVFPPDPGASGQVLSDLAETLAARGWAVRVLAGGAPYPDGEQVTQGDVRVTRTPLPKGRGVVATLRQWQGLGRAALELPSPDVAVTMTDPPMLGLIGPWLRRRGAATIHWCQDLYPSLVPVLAGQVPPTWLRASLDWMAARALADYDRIVATGSCMAERLMSAGLPGDRLVTVPNWPDPGIRPDDPDGTSFRRAADLNDRFIVLYSGNFGRGHPFTGILGAAERLLNAGSPVMLVLAGDGSRRADVVEQVHRRRLDNVRLLPWCDRSQLSAALSAADVHLATLTDAASGLMVPSKVYGALASGRPCVFLGPRDSEVARLILRSGAGSVMPPTDASGLADLLTALAADPAGRHQLGVRAAAAVAPYHLTQAASAFAALARTAADDRQADPGRDSTRVTSKVPAVVSSSQALARGDQA